MEMCGLRWESDDGLGQWEHVCNRLKGHEGDHACFVCDAVSGEEERAMLVMVARGDFG